MPLNKKGWKVVRRLGDGTLVSSLVDYAQDLGCALARFPGLQVYAPGKVTCPPMPERGPLAVFCTREDAEDFAALEIPSARVYECEYELTDIECLWGIDEQKPCGSDCAFYSVPAGTVFASAVRLGKEVLRNDEGR